MTEYWLTVNGPGGAGSVQVFLCPDCLCFVPDQWLHDGAAHEIPCEVEHPGMGLYHPGYKHYPERYYQDPRYVDPFRAIKRTKKEKEKDIESQD